MLCGGGKFYCGLATMPPYVPTFVSEKEHYKANAELVEKSISDMDIDVSPCKYINFQRLDLMDEGIEYYGVLIFASPDIRVVWCLGLISTMPPRMLLPFLGEAAAQRPSGLS